MIVLSIYAQHTPGINSGSLIPYKPTNAINKRVGVLHIPLGITVGELCSDLSSLLQSQIHFPGSGDTDYIQVTALCPTAHAHTKGIMGVVVFRLQNGSSVTCCAD
ncbi:hypothetical protein FKM82_019413 [Ascaphus truei]